MCQGLEEPPSQPCRRSYVAVKCVLILRVRNFTRYLRCFRYLASQRSYHGGHTHARGRDPQPHLLLGLRIQHPQTCKHLLICQTRGECAATREKLPATLRLVRTNIDLFSDRIARAGWLVLSTMSPERTKPLGPDRVGRNTMRFIRNSRPGFVRRIAFETSRLWLL